MAVGENRGESVAIALFALQLTHITEQLDKVLKSGNESDEKITGLCLLLRDYKEVEEHVIFMFPWVKGVKWFAILAGGLLVGGFVTNFFLS